MVANPGCTRGNGYESPQQEEKPSAAKLVLFEPSLCQSERDALVRCETILTLHIGSFFEVGKALFEIKENKLYRADFETFEEYCRKRWDISRFYAYRQIQGAEVMKELLTMGNIPLPLNERQIRPMVGLSSKLLRKTWAKIVNHSKTGQITERFVRQTVNAIKGKQQKNAPGDFEIWQRLTEPLLREALRSLKKGDRESVKSILNKAALLVDIGACSAKGDSDS